MIQNSLSPVAKSRMSSFGGRTMSVEKRILARIETISCGEYFTVRPLPGSACAGSMASTVKLNTARLPLRTDLKSVHTLFKSVLKGSLAVFSFTVLAMLPAQAEPGSGRTVKYSPQDIVSIRAKIRFSTLIVLPPNEDILDFATGDKECWIINGVHNLCYVHPAKAGIRSDLH